MRRTCPVKIRPDMIEGRINASGMVIHEGILIMEKRSKSVKVWDAFVRIFHWTLVSSILGMYITGEHFNTVHVKIGYILISLILVRILWGFFGSKHARFSDFVYPPRTIYDYLTGLIKNTPTHYLGHNPAGGFMIVVMLISLVFTAFAGLQTLAGEGRGPLADNGISVVRLTYADGNEHNDEAVTSRDGHHPGKRKDRFWKEIHETMTGVMIFLIIVHIGGVIVSSWVHKENLILAMVTGKKQGNGY